MAEQSIRVPLAVDAQAKLPFGPVALPMRAIVSLIAVSPLALICLQLGFISATIRFCLVFIILAAGAIVGLPTREGIWIVTWLVYRSGGVIMPSMIRGGRAFRADVKMLGSSVVDSKEKRRWSLHGKSLKYLDYFTDVPRAEIVDEGLIAYRHTGHHAVLVIDGPAMGIQYDGYTVWCDQVMLWLRQLDIPVQFLAMVDHFDSRKAEQAFDSQVKLSSCQPMLVEMERIYSTDLARDSLGLTHYLVLSPGSAGSDGKPEMSKLMTIPSAGAAKREDAERALGTATRLASGFGISARPATSQELQRVLARTVAGASMAACGKDVLQIGGEHQVVMTMSKLPPTILSGSVVEALMGSRVRGMASLHIYQVDPAKARKEVEKQGEILDYAASKGGSDIGVDLAVRETQQVIGQIAARQLIPVRAAL